jgi:dienelactone hydrolase
MPTLSVDPERALVDEVVDVRVDGVAPGERVTLRLTEAVDGDERTATATFEADADGVVGPGEQAPVAGAYEGVRPMGLFQFRRPAPGDRSPAPREARLAALVDGETVATATCERVVLPGGVERVAVDAGGPEVADLYLPAGDGPHPSVVFLGGSSGGLPNGIRPGLLAAHGYAVLALAYFQPQDSGGGDRDFSALPPTLERIPLSYFDDALEWFRGRPEVRAEPVGAVGLSRGGELALLLGARLDPVRAVVAYVPSGLVWPGVAGQFVERPDPAWFADGEPVPYVPTDYRLRDLLRYAAAMVRGRPVGMVGQFERALAAADDDALAAATIPVEDVGGPVLLVSAGDDRLWPSRRLAAVAAERLREHDQPVEHVTCDDAGHAIRAPYLPVLGRTAAPMLPRAPMALGGTPAGYAGADADAWPRVLETLAAGLGEPSADS